MKTLKLTSIIVLFNFNSFCFAQRYVYKDPQVLVEEMRLGQQQNSLIYDVDRFSCLAFPMYETTDRVCNTKIESAYDEIPVLGIKNDQDKYLFSPLVVATAPSRGVLRSSDFLTTADRVSTDWKNIYSNFNQLRFYPNVTSQTLVPPTFSQDSNHVCHGAECRVFDGKEFYHTSSYDSNNRYNINQIEDQEIHPVKYEMIQNALITSFLVRDHNYPGTHDKKVTPTLSFINLDGGTIFKRTTKQDMEQHFLKKAIHSNRAHQTGNTQACNEQKTLQLEEECTQVQKKPRTSTNEKKALELFYVLGYGNFNNNPDMDFPHSVLPPSTSTIELELQAYVIVRNKESKQELYRQLIWGSTGNLRYNKEIKESNHRRLITDGVRNLTSNPAFEFNVKTEIKSGDTYGDEAEDWFVSTDNKHDAHIEYYDTGDESKHFDRILFEITEEKEEIIETPVLDEEGYPIPKLDANGQEIPVIDEEGNPVVDDYGNPVVEIEMEIDNTCPDILDTDGDGDVAELITYTFTYPEVVNTIEVKNYPDKQLIGLKAQGGKAHFISITDNDKVVQTLGENCISPFPNNEHSTTINNGIFEFKIGEHLVWRKLKDINDDTLGRIQFPIQCAFPTVGQSSLNTNQKLVNYNQKPKDNTELHYLLSADKTKVTIKVGTQMRVIDKQAFITANYSFIDALPLQTFNLN